MCYDRMVNLIRQLYRTHKSWLFNANLDDMDRQYILRMIQGDGNKAEYEDTLRYLSQIFYEITGRPAVILIDKYDTPIHAGYNYDYHQEIIGFIRNFLSGGLKDTPFLYKGILRVAKESIFSGLNNLGVYTILMEEFNAYFGFTELEVRNLLTDYDISDRYEDVSRWYNGYLFGGKIIYNPWSIISYVNSKSREPFPYWINTGDTSIIDRLVRRIVIQIMSVHDFSGEPEKVYHALVLGMLVWLSGKYEIRSNRESGYGRYDILLKPAASNPNRTGIIIEFKLVDGKEDGAHEAVLENALQQIENRGYAAELNASGISDILEIAVAFRGKQLWVEHLKRTIQID